MKCNDLRFTNEIKYNLQNCIIYYSLHVQINGCQML